jgi:LPXTG-motif cell wall-anchored protein
MESLKVTRYYFYTILLLTSLLQTTFVSASSSSEIIMNGGFERQFKGWDPYVINDIYGRVNLTSGNSHTGESSLRTYAIPLRKSPYVLKRGGGVNQIISKDVNKLDMVFSFWVMSSLIGENDYTNIRSIINIELTDGHLFNLSYYIAWAPRIINESVANSSDNITYFIPTSLNQWSNVQRSITDDLEPIYDHSNNVNISKFSVIFEMVTISYMLSHDAYWDDISITYETRKIIETPMVEVSPQETPPTQMLPPPETHTSTPTLNPKQQATRPTDFDINNIGLVLIIIIIIAGAAFLLTKRKKQ